MEKKLLAFIFLYTSVQIASASTGMRSDDYLVLVLPLVFLLILGTGYIIKTKLKERKLRKEEERAAVVEDSVES